MKNISKYCTHLIIILIIILTILLILFVYFRINTYVDKYISMDREKYEILDTTKDNLFNMSYMINKDNYLYGYGRPKFKNGKGHHKLYRKIIDLDGKIIENVTEIKLLDQVKDEFVGEVKSFLLDSNFYIYTNFWGKKESLNIFPKWVSNYSKNIYFKSKYKNYIWNIDRNKVIPLFYDKLPGEGFTHKNFLFFMDNKYNYLVITNICPHIIYSVDINSGYMKPYVTTSNILSNYFKDCNICLSGGPIKITKLNCYLVAGHISKGGWGGKRITFFYTFRDIYPFDILSFTPIINFGFNKNLEYCNQIFEKNNKLYISLGVNDDYSVLIKTDINNILSKLFDIYESHRQTIKGGNKVLQFIEYFPNKNSYTCDTTNIWGPDVEAEFIGNILYDYKLLSSNLTNIQESAILAINVHRYSFKDVKISIEKAKPKVLLILGDEWGDRKHYEVLFEPIPLVYRQYRFDHYKNNPNIKILPCGFHCWDLNINKNNTGYRKYIWSFCGTVDKGNRRHNLKKLDLIKPNFFGYTTKYENPDILNNSIFVFCPKGYVNIDSSRPYTASMCGAIPLILCSDEEWNTLYPHFDIEPPWIHVDTIEKIINIIQKLLEQPHNIMKLRSEIKNWYKKIQYCIYNNINNIVMNS